MRLDDQRQSNNVEDRRGQRGRGGRPLGIGVIVVALAASYFLGVDPRAVLGLLEGGAVAGGAQVEQPAGAPGDAGGQFVSRVLASTEDTWNTVFREEGAQYPHPKLVLFTGAYPTACGMGEAAAGPFYCPGDQKIYIDLQFYQVMRERFGVAGDFAQAYVIAHEVGHHIQNVTGTIDRLERMRQGAGRARSNELQVRLELQADCLAGVWAHRTEQSRQFLDPGDIDEALAAASAIGDDTLQRQAQGHVVPDSFTHGTSEQRMRWLKRGLDTGDIATCDTWSAERL